MASQLEADVWGAGTSDLPDHILSLSNEELKQHIRAIDNEVRIMRSEINRIKHETANHAQHIKENKEKIKVNKSLPYLVANVIEVVDPYIDPDEEDQSGAVDLNIASQHKGVVVKTSTRQTVFLPVPGLVRAEEVKPGELVGVNKDSYIMLEKLPTEFDSRVQAMEVDEKPTEDYTDIGGLDKQIQELIEAVVLPMTQAEKFQTIGIRAPKGVLLYGPPGKLY